MEPSSSYTPGELVTRHFASLLNPLEEPAQTPTLQHPELSSLPTEPPDELPALIESDNDEDDTEEDEGEDDEDGEEEEPVAPKQPRAVDITLEALLYSHIVLNCGGQEFHAPVMSSLMLVSLISLTPATFFVGLGIGVPVFCLAQHCLKS
jgi:hypothetical protein